MSSIFEKLKIETASKDIGAGVVVFLVALPLCMGIALASGAPVLSGLIAGVIGGTVVAFFSGSELSVSGPAAGLAAVVSTGIATLGSFELFLVGIVIAGVLQIALGLLRAGSIGHFIPNGVIRGMLAAIGVVIILKQVPHLIGWDSTAEVDEAVVGLPSSGLFSWISHLDAHVDIGALVIGLTCLTLLILWEMPFLKQMAWTKLVPGALLTVVIGTTLNEYLLLVGSSLAIPHGATHLVQIPLVSQGAELFRFPDFGAMFLSSKVWILAVTLALVGSLETLLSVEATDKLDPEQRISDTNRELLAQGIGNTISGLVGGLPITSVIIRSSTNIYAGARSRISSIVHGLLLASAILIIPDFLNRIPLATLAAVLIMVGYKLTSVHIIRSPGQEDSTSSFRLALPSLLWLQPTFL